MSPFDKKPRQTAFLPCGAVAANRARRVAAKEQAPKVLVPLIAIAVFVGLMVDRLQYILTGFSNRLRPLVNRQAERSVPNSVCRANLHDFSIRRDDRDIRVVKSDAADHRQSPEQIARLVAFMIRNKGRIDNAVIEKNWRDLDRHDMPFAVYLRHIEAENRWHDLEIDLKRLARKTGKSTKSGSKRDRDITSLIPEWSRRGEELLAKLDEEQSDDLQAALKRPEHSETPPKPPGR